MVDHPLISWHHSRVGGRCELGWDGEKIKSGQIVRRRSFVLLVFDFGLPYILDHQEQDFWTLPGKTSGQWDLHVTELKQALQERHGIAPQHQVLVVNGGECLSGNRRVCSFNAGTDTNPIFLFSKELIVLDRPPLASIPPRPQSNLPSRAQDSILLPAVFPTVALRTQLALELQEAGAEFADTCETLVLEQHLMQQGWAAMVANLEDCARAQTEHLQAFTRTLAAFRQQQPPPENTLTDLVEAASLMANIPLLPCLIHPPTTVSLHICQPEDSKARLESEPCESKPPHVVHGSNESLLDWVNMQCRPDDLQSLSRKCLDSLARLDEATVKTFLADCQEMLMQMDNVSMKEVKGLEDRLYALDQRLDTCRRLLAEQGELAQGFLANQKRAENLKDCSVLPDLCLSHANQLRIMLSNHGKLLELQECCCQAKQELADNLHVRLRWCYFVMHQADGLIDRLVALSHLLSDLEARLKAAQQLVLAPKLYCLAVAETARRRQFSQQYKQWSINLVKEGQKVYEVERAKREAFAKVFANSFLRGRLFRGLQSWPSFSFCTQLPRDFDSDLPEVTAHDVHVLRATCPPQLQPFLRVPEDVDLGRVEENLPEWSGIVTQDFKHSTSPVQPDSADLRSPLDPSAVDPEMGQSNGSRDLSPDSMDSQVFDFETVTHAALDPGSLATEDDKTRPSLALQTRVAAESSPVSSNQQTEPLTPEAAMESLFESVINAIGNRGFGDGRGCCAGDWAWGVGESEEEESESVKEWKGLVCGLQEHARGADVKRYKSGVEENYQYGEDDVRETDRVALEGGNDERCTEERRMETLAGNKGSDWGMASEENGRMKEEIKHSSSMGEVNVVSNDGEEMLETHKDKEEKERVSSSKEKHRDLLVESRDAKRKDCTYKVPQQDKAIDIGDREGEDVRGLDRATINTGEVQTEVQDVWSKAQLLRCEENTRLKQHLTKAYEKGLLEGQAHAKVFEVKLETLQTQTNELATQLELAKEQLHEEKARREREVELAERLRSESLTEAQKLSEKIESERREAEAAKDKLLAELVEANEQFIRLSQEACEVRAACEEREGIAEDGRARDKAKAEEVQAHLLRDLTQQADEETQLKQELEKTIASRVLAVNEVDELRNQLEKKVGALADCQAGLALAEVQRVEDQEVLRALLGGERERAVSELIEAGEACEARWKRRTEKVEEEKNILEIALDEAKAECKRLGTEYSGRKTGFSEERGHVSTCERVARLEDEDKEEGMAGSCSEGVEQGGWRYSAQLISNLRKRMRELLSQQFEDSDILKELSDEDQALLSDRDDLVKHLLLPPNPETLPSHPGHPPPPPPLSLPPREGNRGRGRQRTESFSVVLEDHGAVGEEEMAGSQMESSMLSLGEGGNKDGKPVKTEKVSQQKERRSTPPRQKLMSQSVSGSVVRQAEKLTIKDFQVGDLVLIILDERHDNYVLFTIAPTLYFLHSDSLGPLGLCRSAGALRRPWVLGRVLQKEYCQAKKVQNRFRVPLGTKFFRVKAEPWGRRPTSRAPTTTGQLSTTSTQASSHRSQTTPSS
uniref:RB1-inducible coiled-coil protein 1-like n=1 Tax=Myxine glutinosa TaxID=7769 RepID=UPI00358E03FD